MSETPEFCYADRRIVTKSLMKVFHTKPFLVTTYSNPALVICHIITSPPLL